MDERFMEARKRISEPGPVITISRECGCAGREFAEKLTDRINSQIINPAHKWKWVSKEILQLASEELRIDRSQIKDLINANEKSFFDDFVHSFTDKNYIHEGKIRKAIEEVVRNIAIEGKAVIVGRGSEALTEDIPQSLKIKLFAPLKWKISAISECKKISIDKAKRVVIETDAQREKFREKYLTKNRESHNYDLELNCSKFTQEEMIELILKIARIKSFI